MLTIEILTQGEIYIRRIVEQLRRFSIEAKQLAEEAVMLRPKNIATLREEAIDSSAGVFESALMARDPKRHVARLPLNSQFSKKSYEIGISAIIVNNESGIDRNRLSRSGILNAMGMGMSTESVVSLEKMDVILAAQKISSRHPGDSRSDYGDGLFSGRGVWIRQRATRQEISSSRFEGKHDPRRSRVMPSQLRALRA